MIQVRLWGGKQLVGTIGRQNTSFQQPRIGTYYYIPLLSPWAVGPQVSTYVPSHGYAPGYIYCVGKPSIAVGPLFLLSRETDSVV